MDRIGTLFYVAAVATLIGCGDRKSDGWMPTGEAPLSERQAPLVAALSTKLGIGADCAAVSHKGCASGICFKTGHNRNTGFICSQPCVTDADCPKKKMGCMQVYPSDKGWFCVPAEKHEDSPDAGSAR